MATTFARTRKAPSRSGALHYAFCPRCDAEYGGWRGLTQDFDAAQAQAEQHNLEEHEEPSVDQGAAKRAEEDAAWAARARLAAREQVAQQVANLPSATLDALREAAHADRSNLVNLYIGANRKERIAETDLIIGVIEEEQAVRAGLASSEDILAAFS